MSIIREESKSISIRLTKPGYEEGKPLLSSLNAEDLRQIDSAYQELSREGKVLPQLQSTNGYRVLKLSVRKVTLEE